MSAGIRFGRQIPPAPYRDPGAYPKVNVSGRMAKVREAMERPLPTPRIPERDEAVSRMDRDRGLV